MKLLSALSFREWMCVAAGAVLSAGLFAVGGRTVGHEQQVAIPSVASTQTASRETEHPVASTDISPLSSDEKPTTTKRIVATPAPTAPSTAGAGTRQRLGRENSLPRPSLAELHKLSMESLRALAEQDNVDAMLVLGEKLMDISRPIEDHNEAFQMFDIAAALGSSEAQMAKGENFMKHVAHTDPDMSDEDIYLFRLTAAGYYTTALFMGDVHALERIQAVLPANVTRVDVKAIATFGYFGYLNLLERRALAGLPPLEVHFPTTQQAMDQRAALREGG